MKWWHVVLIVIAMQIAEVLLLGGAGAAALKLARRGRRGAGLLGNDLDQLLGSGERRDRRGVPQW